MPKTQRTSPPHPEHHANDARTLFRNPWPSSRAPTWAELRQQAFPLGWYSSTGGDKAPSALQVVKPDWGERSLKHRQLDRKDCMIGTWLGHAGVLVEVPLPAQTSQQAVGSEKHNAWLLFDPIFSARAGPTQYTGPHRWNALPCQISDLPGCDLVFISHNHYDHLDLPSIKAIIKNFPRSRYFVPLGLRRWLIETGVPPELVYELDWWQGREVGFEAVSPAHQSGESIALQVSCVPAQHNSGRAALDQGTTLWCGWVVERFTKPPPNRNTQQATKKRRGSIYHAGDTGYRRTARSQTTCPAFAEIGQRFGPIDLSFIPIWRGGTLSFVSSLGVRLSPDDVPAAHHCSPTDAVNIHLDVRSSNTIGIHFGTFVGSENEIHEAKDELRKACADQDVPSLREQSTKAATGRAGTLNIGESYIVQMS